MNFKQFVLLSETKDLEKTINKIPKGHRKYVTPYKISFESGCTLKGDGDNIGAIDEKKKTIKVASPWNYGREYAVLHEIGHIVWKYFVNADLRKEWNKIVQNTNEKQDQNNEELFCMAYANTYSKSKIEIHNHDHWENFIKKLPN